LLSNLEGQGEKRSLAFSFGDQPSDEGRAAKRARLDEPGASQGAPTTSLLQANETTDGVKKPSDVMDIDSQLPEEPPMKPVVLEALTRFKGLEQKEMQLNRDLALLKNGIFIILFA